MTFLPHSFRKSLSSHGERFHCVIYALVLLKLLARLTPDRTVEEQKFLGTLCIACYCWVLGMQCNATHYQCSEGFWMLNIGTFILFPIIQDSKYKVVSLKVKKYKKRVKKNIHLEFSFRHVHWLILPHKSNTKRLRVNQGSRWHFFEVNSFSSKTFLIKSSSPSNFGSPSGWSVDKDGPNTKCRSTSRAMERLRTMIGIQESLAFNQGMKENPAAGSFSFCLTSSYRTKYFSLHSVLVPFAALIMVGT